MRASDKEEFIKAYQEIHGPLMRFCMVKSRGIMDAEDLANDTLLVGLEKYSQLKDKKALLGYLFTTANNISLNHLRRKKFSGPYDELMANNMPTSHNSIESSVDVGILYEALDQLPPLQKEAVTLFEISDLPIKEIMVIQDAGESSVKQRIKRGREKLTAIMQEKDRRKIAVVVAVSLTTNSFSMSNLDQYFKALKELPLPISEADALAKISQFQIPVAAATSAKVGSVLLKKNTIAALIMGGGISATVLFSGASISGQKILPANEIELAKNITSLVVSNVNEIEKPLENNDFIQFQNVVIQDTAQDLEVGKNRVKDSVNFLGSNLAITAINWGSYEAATPKREVEMINLSPKKDFDGYPKKSTVSENNNIFDLSGINEIEINNIGEKIEIKTWDKQSVKIESVIEVECKKEKDKEIILNNIKLISSTEDDRFILKSNTEEGRVSTIQIGGLKHNVIQYGNGEKAKYKKLNRSYVITMPHKMNLKLNNKYSDIDISAFEGNLSGSIYESTFDTEKITGEVKMKFRYCKVNMKDVNYAHIDAYETRFNFNNAEDLRLDSKYCVVRGQNLKSFTSVSYEDNIQVNQIGELEMFLNYSYFKCSTDIEKVWLQAVNSKVHAESIDEFELHMLKYALLNVNKIGNLDVKNVYESKLFINDLNSIEVKKSKYSYYTIGDLANKALIDSYEDKLKISNVGSDFRQLKFEGKYTNYNLAIDTSSRYGLNIKTHYGSLDYSKLNLFNKELTDKGDHVSLKGVVNGQSYPSTTVKFDCYEGSIVIR